MGEVLSIVPSGLLETTGKAPTRVGKIIIYYEPSSGVGEKLLRRRERALEVRYKIVSD